MTGESEIKVDCPKCLASLKVPTEKGGTRIVCPECKRSLLVPTAQAAGNAIFDDLFDSPETNSASQTDTDNPPSSATTVEADPILNADDSVFDNIETAIEAHRAAEETTKEKFVDAPTKDSPQPEPDVPIGELAPNQGPDSGDPLASLTNSNLDLEEVEPPVQRLNISDEFSLEDHLKSSDLDLTPITNEDPFGEDSDKPLNIDGISPNIKVDNIVGVKCKVCDTRIHVNIDQNGETIECPMCYSEVEIVFHGQIQGINYNMPISPQKQREENSKPKNEAPTPSHNLDKLPEFDNSPLTLAPIENDALPGELPVEVQDLLKPKITPDVAGPQETTGDAPSDQESESKSHPRKKKKKQSAEYGSKDYWESKVTEVEPEKIDLPEIITNETIALKNVTGWISSSFTSPELIYRTLVAIAMLGFTYTMFDIFHYSFNSEDIGKFNKILGTILPCIAGGGSLMVGLLALLTACSMVFQNSLNGVSKTENWPGFSLSDWLGPLTQFLFSFWLACLPGGLIGAFFAFATQQNTWLVAATSLSAFLIAPILYTCVAFNGSAFNVFSYEVFKTFRKDDVSWLYYLPYTLAAWIVFFIGTLILFIPTFIFSIAGATLQVLMLICFAAIAGVHTGRIMHKLQKS